MSDNWKSIFEVSGSLMLDIASAMGNRSQLVKSDDGQWCVEVTTLGILTLVHEPSQTASAAIITADNIILAETFHFLGYNPESVRERKALPDADHWELRHRRMMGVSDPQSNSGAG